MKGNPHYRPAQDALYTSTDAYGQVEATLALAFEQRTANLIAFNQAQWDAHHNDELTPEGHAFLEKSENQIIERLGLQ